MSRWLLCFLVFFVVSISRGHASELLCRDWQPYKTVLCYRVFADEETATWTEAKARCQSKGMRLLSIGNHGEQKFVINLLFKESHLAGNVWIDGAFFNGSFRHGKTGLELSYSRWAHNFPKKLPDYCIEISGDLETRGRWRDVPCATRNALVCQQTQRWDWTQVMTVQRQMQTALQQLTQSTQTLERKLSQTAEELKVTKQKLVETNLQLYRTRREFSKQLVNSKQIIGNELSQTKQEMSETKNNFLPIYVQQPNSKTPSKFWLWALALSFPWPW